MNVSAFDHFVTKKLLLTTWRKMTCRLKAFWCRNKNSSMSSLLEHSVTEHGNEYFLLKKIDAVAFMASKKDPATPKFFICFSIDEA